jgi:hypothetical protein
MLVACRLAGLSALDAHYAGVKWRTQCGATQRCAHPTTKPLVIQVAVMS